MSHLTATGCNLLYMFASANGHYHVYYYYYVYHVLLLLLLLVVVVVVVHKFPVSFPTACPPHWRQLQAAAGGCARGPRPGTQGNTVKTC